MNLCADFSNRNLPERSSNPEFRKTLCQTTSLAERYIADIREIDNQIKTISEIRKTYREWIQQVYEEYFKMTEIPTVPDDLHDRFNVVEDLAGCVLDMHFC